MTPPLTIVGQGIAGSMLAWHCERAGIAFEIFDRGHLAAASRVGAGLVSPVTGRRLVPTWRFAEWRDEALQIYRDLAAELGLTQPVVRELRLRRVYRDAAERARFATRCNVPEVAQWVESLDDDGLWLRGAIQVDTHAIIAALRERWWRQGCLREQSADAATMAQSGRAVIWCVGADAPRVVTLGEGGAGATWEPSKGEVLRGVLPGLAPDTVLNDGQWIMPMGGDEVRVGATFQRQDLSPGLSARSLVGLRAAARRLTGRDMSDVEGLSGLRVTVPDRRPVVGWIDGATRARGVFGGLAAKGALWAPVLAAQWVADGLEGGRIDPAAQVNRFG
ncbi:NAD(P)/FAD-dependent oxidoreductase [Actomonas aquatica]|uniref:FAD-dependent oxidoreductase n=1 Tax=Actomonas aquatica TaxID=2866162 RepID=A0ABZ1C535_9BACT|nr:FAD-dependent oxidoreductase [Opitutus sp. WL0086]WRQ86631.1 FAD-dependent oxidoreductase [Opitutus sp. WL0086]